MTNIAVCGSRGYPKSIVLNWLNNNLKQFIKTSDIIFHGACSNSPDEWVELWAIENKIITNPIPANWNLYGKSAGFIRNKEIVLRSNKLIAFWNGTIKNSGTFNTIQLAVELEKIIVIVPYNKDNHL